LEAITVVTLLAAFLPVLIPSPHLEAGALRERLEHTQARLIVESELDRAALLASKGSLTQGQASVSVKPYPSSADLLGLRLTRWVSKSESGLSAVKVRAVWKSLALTSPDAELRFELTTWVGIK
jgi:hypothetical protein